MSAICGIIHLDGKPVAESDLLAMVASSPYRGPDGYRVHLDGRAGFAYLAFDVTPESAHENQPLVSDDGQLVLERSRQKTVPGWKPPTKKGAD